MASPDRPSHFLRLPGELRNQIYEYYLVVQYTIDVQGIVNRRSTRKLYDLPANPEEKPTLHLLATCRQIRSEALSICYSTNKFQQDMDDYAYPFLDRLRDDSLSCLKSITLALPIRFLDSHARDPHLRETCVVRLIDQFNKLGKLHGPRGLDIAAISSTKFSAVSLEKKLCDMRRLEWSKEADRSWRVELRPFEELNYHLRYPNVRRMAHHHWY